MPFTIDFRGGARRTRSDADKHGPTLSAPRVSEILPFSERVMQPVGMMIPTSQHYYWSSSSKISSTGFLKSRAILNASGSEGSYLPFSIALTEFLETPSSLARSACVQRLSARKTRMWFFISRPHPLSPFGCPPNRVGSYEHGTKHNNGKGHTQSESGCARRQFAHRCHA